MQPARLPTPAPPTRAPANRLWRAFDFAFQGVLHATRTQPNMRIHLAAAALALLATLWLRLERSYVALVVIVIAIVLAMELLNTAVEAIVDLMTQVEHPLAKVAKDAAAGAVLVVSLGALIVGYLVFYEGITAVGVRVGVAVAAVPRNVVVVSLALTGIATVFGKALLPGHGTPLRGGAVSGHAALAFAGATLIALFASSVLVGLLAFALAALVAQSRVEGNMHSLREVVRGALLGASLTLGVSLLARF